MHRTAWLAAAILLGACAPERAPEGTPAPRTQQPTASPSAAPSPAEERGSARQLVWVAVEDEGRVVKVDVEARRVVRSVRVPGSPHNITVAGPVVAVALPDTGRIALIRGRRVRPVDLGGSPHDVKATGHLVVVANEGAARLELVSTAGRHLGSIPLAADPHDLAISPNGRTAWVSLDGDDRLAVVGLDSRSVRRYVPTGRRPHDLLFAPDGRLWVTDWEGALHVFDHGRMVRSIPLGVEAHHLAFTPDGGPAWITDHGAHRLFVLDARRARVEEEIRLPGAPHHVAVTADGRWAVVADHEGGTALVFRVATGRLVGRVRVGSGPHGVWAA